MKHNVKLNISSSGVFLYCTYNLGLINLRWLLFYGSNYILVNINRRSGNNAIPALKMQIFNYSVLTYLMKYIVFLCIFSIST